MTKDCNIDRIGVIHKTVTPSHCCLLSFLEKCSIVEQVEMISTQQYARWMHGSQSDGGMNRAFYHGQRVAVDI